MTFKQIVRFCRLRTIIVQWLEYGALTPETGVRIPVVVFFFIIYI